MTDQSSAVSDGPIGYVSAITLKALSERAEGHGFVVACAGYDTTIPLYAHPAPPAAASVREAQEKLAFAICEEICDQIDRGVAESRKLSACVMTSGRVKAALNAVFTELAPTAPACPACRNPTMTYPDGRLSCVRCEWEEPSAPTREEIIEECAREADRLHEDPAWSPGYKNASAAIARKIRRLKSAPQSQAESAATYSEGK